jgi:hypothetical protein
MNVCAIPLYILFCVSVKAGEFWGVGYGYIEKLYPDVDSWHEGGQFSLVKRMVWMSHVVVWW